MFRSILTRVLVVVLGGPSEICTAVTFYWARCCHFNFYSGVRLQNQQQKKKKEREREVVIVIGF